MRLPVTLTTDAPYLRATDRSFASNTAANVDLLNAVVSVTCPNTNAADRSIKSQCEIVAQRLMRTDDDERAGAATTSEPSGGNFFSHQSVVASDNTKDDSSGCASMDASEFATAADSATVDLVLEMTATLDADGFPQPSIVDRADVIAALRRAGGDVALAVDDVLSVIAIKQMRADEQRAREAQQQLQWHELCAGLGVREGDAFIRALERLPEAEKSALVSSDGGFLQQLLLELDEEETRERAADADAHPVTQLQAMYPNYRLEVIESVFEQHGFDVNVAADALHNLRGVDRVQSFAAVVSAQGRAAQEQRELQLHGPNVESLGHFPVLPSAAPKHKLSQKQRRQQQLQGYHRKPSRLAKLNGSRVNAWERQDFSVSNGGVLESTLSSELKIDRLKGILPTIDRSVIQATFFLNGCNSDVTEAALREIFSLPVVVQQAEIVEEEDDASFEDAYSDSSFT
ncbi:hypothetical protein PybrP1_005237, partial [[Pythium] brassicae (nom. inval.)]